MSVSVTFAPHQVQFWKACANVKAQTQKQQNNSTPKIVFAKEEEGAEQAPGVQQSAQKKTEKNLEKSGISVIKAWKIVAFFIKQIFAIAFQKTFYAS